MVTKPMTNPDVEIKTPRDPNTLSNYHNYVTRHTSVDFEIDFEKKRLVGSVVLRMESLVDGDGVDVVLDSRYVQQQETHVNRGGIDNASWTKPNI
jgi:leukotriene-A4 hydrolase